MTLLTAEESCLTCCLQRRKATAMITGSMMLDEDGAIQPDGIERAVQLDSDMLVPRNMNQLMNVELNPPEMEGKGNRVLAA